MQFSVGGDKGGWIEIHPRKIQYPNKSRVKGRISASLAITRCLSGITWFTDFVRLCGSTCGILHFGCEWCNEAGPLCNKPPGDSTHLYV